MKKLKMKTPLDFHVGQVVCILPYVEHKKRWPDRYHQRFQTIKKINPWSDKKDLGWEIRFSNGDACHHKNIRALKPLEVGSYEKS